jgi:hypothetical protein
MCAEHHIKRAVVLLIAVKPVCLAKPHLTLHEGHGVMCAW